MDGVTYGGYKGVYKRGLAVGESDVVHDVLRFYFQDPETGQEERFEFPTFKAYPVVTYNGYWYEAPIDKLRELEREAAGG